MTFTEQVKDEISKEDLNPIENRYLLLGYIMINGNFVGNRLEIVLENPSVARKLYKTLKYCYNEQAKITIRIQKKFKLKKIYILEVNDNRDKLKDEIDNIMLSDEESKFSFIKGVFLGTGSINNPSKSYHLEMLFFKEEDAVFMMKLLNSLGYNFKMLKRERKYMLYIKSSESISDFLKLLGTNNALFHYEDVRIYRDHKNMVNRLNNCEQANYEKQLKTSDNQLEKIKFLKDNDYYNLLDDKTREVADVRLKYPEESYASLAEILSSENDKAITKSYVNHHFRKINDIYDKIIKNLSSDTKI